MIIDIMIIFVSFLIRMALLQLYVIHGYDSKTCTRSEINVIINYFYIFWINIPPASGQYKTEFNVSKY